MPSPRDVKVAIIGSGNVATPLAKAIDSLEGYRVVQIVSRNIDHARHLSLQMADATASSSVAATDPEADIVIISASDDSIPSIVSELPRKNRLYLHTSGGVGMEALADLSDNYGVLYPLQTFTRGVEIDLSEVPLFIEGSNPHALKSLRKLAEGLSRSVTEADSDKRRTIHVAAVFGCNFANYCWTMAAEILEDNGMDFNLLKPIISETARKAFDSGPEQGQTGPARRGDTTVTRRHLESLDGEKAEIYRILTQSIMRHYNNEPN